MKQKQILAADVDCTGFMYRKKGTSQNILSFYSEETDLITGSRIPGLSGKEIVISDMVDGKLVTYWEKIWPSIK